MQIPRLIVGVVIALLGLLIIVVGFGLVHNQIDPQPLALAILPAITGLLIAFGVRRNGGGGQ